MVDNKMKILLLEWDSMCSAYFQKALRNSGFDVDIMEFSQKTENMRNNGPLTEKIATKIIHNAYTFVFSFNFFPVIAMACKACRVPYLSWIYDSPFINLYSETVKFETNFIFHFDQAEVIKLRELGVNHIFYLPLAADTDVYDEYDLDKLTEKEREYYTSDISFVGSMYTEKKQQLYNRFEQLDEYTKGYLDAVINAQMNVYGCNFLENAITPQIEEKLMDVAPLNRNPDGFEKISWVYADYFLARKLAAIERNQIMRVVSEEVPNQLSKSIEVKLYTHEKTPYLKQVKNMGKVDYYNQCSYVFKGSKINLNISLRSIRSGIPLRAMEILGCGGFLLTNYQSDFLEHFIPGEDYVYFDSMQDLKEKVVYYLSHEDERCEIARNGYHKVKEEHNYFLCLSLMLQIVFGEDIEKNI